MTPIRNLRERFFYKTTSNFYFNRHFSKQRFFGSFVLIILTFLINQIDKS